MEEPVKKEKWAWARRKDHNFFIPFVIVVTTVVALWLLFFAHNSVIGWIRAGLEVQQQEKEKARLQAEIDAMDAEIDALTSNQDSLEQFARETYHFAAPGDDVFIVE